MLWIKKFTRINSITLALYLFGFNSPEKHEFICIFSKKKNMKQDSLRLNIMINGKLNTLLLKVSKLWISVCILFVTVNPATFFLAE